MMDIFADYNWLPVVFVALMGIAILAYVILDGYDLGVGILLAFVKTEHKDIMISSIIPFWDANETWLVLGIGILLVAFPEAHGIILTALYIPVATMLVGLILRGVAFDFRAKANITHKAFWDRIFFIGSLLAALSQGYMLGMYIMGFKINITSTCFACLTAMCLAAGYSFIGAAWLIMKTSNALQKKAVHWARWCLWWVALGLALVSIASPLVSMRIFDKWFSFPNIILLAQIPLFTCALILLLAFVLKRLPYAGDRYCWVPFVGGIGIFILGFNGLAYSFFPYIVPNELTIWQAASASESLLIILAGVVVVLPCIVGYTIFAHRVFWGKAKKVSYY